MTDPRKLAERALAKRAHPSYDKLARALLNALDERDRLRAVAEAARDPFLVLLESHPDAEGHVNAEMARAAQRLRTALTDLDATSKPEP